MTELDPAAVIEAVARDPRLRAFTGHGRIETLPARQARRHLLLDKIAQAFEPGVRYSERRVSLFLGALHADYAALRRYLVDEEFLSRSDGQYWRSGGTVLPSPPDEPRAQGPPPGRDGRPGNRRSPVAGVAAGGWRPALMRQPLGPADSVGAPVDLAFLVGRTSTALPGYDCGRLLV